jgi:hypothetical protein
MITENFREDHVLETPDRPRIVDRIVRLESLAGGEIGREEEEEINF